MHYVLVFGRLAADLFAYDTSNGEQEFLGRCEPPRRVLPSRMAALQKTSAFEYAVQLQTLLNDSSIDVSVPIIVASERSLPNSFVRKIIESFRYTIQRECRVDAAGQMGFNQVLREQLVTDDNTSSVRVATAALVTT